MHIFRVPGFDLQILFISLTIFGLRNTADPDEMPNVAFIWVFYLGLLCQRTHLQVSSIQRVDIPNSTLDKQLICVNTQLKSSKKQLK